MHLPLPVPAAVGSSWIMLVLDVWLIPTSSSSSAAPTQPVLPRCAMAVPAQLTLAPAKWHPWSRAVTVPCGDIRGVTMCRGIRDLRGQGTLQT